MRFRTLAFVIRTESSDFRCGERRTADPSASLLMNKPETGALSAAYPTQAQRQGLNGAPNLRCRYGRQGHCSLNLPQASQFLGMTKGRAVNFIGTRQVGWTERRPRVPPVPIRRRAHRERSEDTCRSHFSRPAESVFPNVRRRSNLSDRQSLQDRRPSVPAVSRWSR
jgi:hypothetical protein